MSRFDENLFVSFKQMFTFSMRMGNTFSHSDFIHTYLQAIRLMNEIVEIKMNIWQRLTWYGAYLLNVIVSTNPML